MEFSFIKYKQCDLITEGSEQTAGRYSVHEASRIAEELHRPPALGTVRHKRPINVLQIKVMSHASVDVFTSTLFNYNTTCTWKSNNEIN